MSDGWIVAGALFVLFGLPALLVVSAAIALGAI